MNIHLTLLDLIRANPWNVILYPMLSVVSIAISLPVVGPFLKVIISY